MSLIVQYYTFICNKCTFFVYYMWFFNFFAWEKQRVNWGKKLRCIEGVKLFCIHHKIVFSRRALACWLRIKGVFQKCFLTAETWRNKVYSICKLCVSLPLRFIFWLLRWGIDSVWFYYATKARKTRKSLYIYSVKSVPPWRKIFKMIHYLKMSSLLNRCYFIILSYHFEQKLS
jgi:hypothetical protein